MPKLSIITINLNNATGLHKTIESVVTQTFTDYEYIIIDGASTDGSIDIIKEYFDKITYWVSEPDKGIYNAMNKGIAKAIGEYCIFLNSGDYFVDNESLYKLLNRGNDKDLIYGNLLVDDGTRKWIKYYPPLITFGYLLKDTLPHPATLIRRELLNRNPYNEQNKITSDWEFFIYTVCILNASYKYVNTEVTVFNHTGISSYQSNDELIKNEKKLFLQKQFGTYLKDYEEMEELKIKLMTNPFWYYSKKFFKKIFHN